ncbi:MFS transporter [Streptomyces sp. NPDC059009]|uniref:MFS transporter n=1 Tax=Streptomyces sp. NPDC059009 TaxID=3346694 RepID=UPI00368BC041
MTPPLHTATLRTTGRHHSDRGRGHSPRLTLTASVTGAVVVALDGTVLTVAQPALRHDLDASFAQVQWTSTGYLIAVASLLVFAGRLGDRYGHRRLFALGTLGFAVTSAGIAVAPGIGPVIGLRVAQGVFGALLQPATLGMLRAAYPPDRLGRPLAVRTAAIGLAAATGPLIGGALTTHWGWRSAFVLSAVPAFALGALALTLLVREAREARDAQEVREAREVREAQEVREVREARGDRLDLPGAALLALTLGCLVHACVGLPDAPLISHPVLSTGVALAAGLAFVRHERRTESPLVPASVSGSTALTSALAVLVTASAAMFGALYVATYFLQDVLGLDPLQSSLRALPLAVAMVAAALLAAVLERRHGARRTTAAAMALLTLGVLALSRLGPDSGPLAIGGGFLLLGAGFGTVMVTATTVVVRRAPVADAGVAGGLQQTAMNVGPTLGIAVAGTVLGSSGSFTSAMGTALTVLAVVAGAGALLSGRLGAP